MTKYKTTDPNTAGLHAGAVHLEVKGGEVEVPDAQAAQFVEAGLIRPLTAEEQAAEAKAAEPVTDAGEAPGPQAEAGSDETVGKSKGKTKKSE